MNNNNHEILLKGSTFVALDFETTGLKPENSRVIEVGLVKFNAEKILDTFSTFVNPQIPVPERIIELTGISDKDLIDAPLFEDIAYKIKDFIDELPLVAHNAKFDFGFLKHEFLLSEIPEPTNATICTAILARKLFPQLKSKNLTSVAKHLNIYNKNTHRALSDALTAAKIFMKMLPRLEEEHGIRMLEQLNTFQKIPPKAKSIKFVKKSLLNDLANIPDLPGVYFYKDKNGKIIYVGKAKSLKKRLASYFTSYAGRKAKKIIRTAKNIEIKQTNSELTALLAETKLIKLHNPEFNSLLKKFPQTWFIKIDKTKDFPVPKITSVLKSDYADYFGPYRNRETALEILDVVNKAFQLRECTEKEFKKKKKCYLADLGRCSAPCVMPNKKEYAEELNKASEFLRGENQQALNILLNRMKMFSSRMDFEAAAEIRDTAQKLLNQLKRTSILAEPINSANAIIEVTCGNRKDFLLFTSGKFYIKNDITEKSDLFTEDLYDYFNNTLFAESEILKEDLEYFKISLAWLNSHRDLVRIYYLKNYESIDELFFEMKRNFI